MLQQDAESVDDGKGKLRSVACPGADPIARVRYVHMRVAKAEWVSQDQHLNAQHALSGSGPIGPDPFSRCSS